MKKEVKIVSEERGIVRITTSDERWYAKGGNFNESTGLPEYKAYPSVTWIVSVYPKPGLQKYRDNVGAEEAELAKRLGGERGSKVHEACSAIIMGEEVRVDSKFTNPNTGNLEELTPDEIRCIQSFVEWKKAFNPKFLAWDENVYSDKHAYAGTLDAVAQIGDEVFLIDFKTSKVLGTDYDMQVSAYKEGIVNGENILEGVDRARADIMRSKGQSGLSDIKLALLQLGSNPTKTSPEEYRWKVVEDKFPLFLATKAVWADMYETQIKDRKGFSQKDYPFVLSPALKLSEALADMEPVQDFKENESNSNDAELEDMFSSIPPVIITQRSGRKVK